MIVPWYESAEWRNALESRNGQQQGEATPALGANGLLERVAPPTWADSRLSPLRHLACLLEQTDAQRLQNRVTLSAHGGVRRIHKTTATTLNSDWRGGQQVILFLVKPIEAKQRPMHGLSFQEAHRLHLVNTVSTHHRQHRRKQGSSALPLLRQQE